MRWLVAIITISALIFGCSPKKAEKGATEKAPEKIISRDEAVGSLPCFKCHSYQKFSAPPQKGIFPHQRHMDAGYHCNQCHDPRGHRHMVVNRNICSNCHSMKIITFDRTVLPSKFNHEAHTRLFNCKECHPGVFLMSAGAARVTMKDIDNGAYCGACHDGKKAFASSECAKCHKMKGFEKELVYKVDGIGNVVFSHKFHTTAFSCDSCHPRLFDMKKTHGKIKMDDMYQGKTCGSCHNGNIATPVTDCGKCHKS